MRAWLIAFGLLLAACGLASHAAANPFQGGSAPREASGGNAIYTAIAKAQRDLNQTISAKFRELDEGGSPTALFAVLALSFLYGVLHAAGPGHGKTVVASYLLARPQSWSTGIMIAAMSSLVQGLSSIAIVVVLALLFEIGGLDIMANATAVEVVSYGLIVLVGVWLFAQAVTGRGCHHHPHGHDHHACEAGHHHGTTAREPTTMGLILAAGLAPCASAIIVLLFALAQGAIVLGIIAALTMSLGIAATVCAIALASIFGRRLLTGFAAASPRATLVLERGLAVGGSLLVIGFAGLLLIGAWARL
jgi:nickel/cobalt transporter (NicO) family protein